MNPINHVAIIMDGNGRWGLKKKKSRNMGHKEGLNTVEKIIRETIKKKLSFLHFMHFQPRTGKDLKRKLVFCLIYLKIF